MAQISPSRGVAPVGIQDPESAMSDAAKRKLSAEGAGVARRTLTFLARLTRAIFPAPFAQPPRPPREASRPGHESPMQQTR